MYISDQSVGSSPCQWIKTVVKVIAFIALLPIAAIGVIIKLIGLKEQSFRVFCAQKIPENSICPPKLFEIFQHVHSTADFTLDNEMALVFKPLRLYECSCISTGAFHRFRSPRRNNLENAIVQRLVAIRPDKSLPIHLLSMGSGGLMSDFLTLEKLVLAGFKTITIDCIDPVGIDLEGVQRIKKFFDGYKEVSITIQAYKKIDEVPEEKTEYSALLAIDYDSLSGFNFEERLICTGDLMKAYHRLSRDGFLALGYSDDDTLSGPQMDPIDLSSRPSFIDCLANELTLRLPKQKEITIRLPDPYFAGISHLLFLALAMRKSDQPYEKISIILPNNDPNEIKQFKKMMQDLFPTAKIEIDHPSEQIKKCDLLFTGEVQKEFISKEYLSYLNPQSTTYIIYRLGKMVRQSGDQQDNLLTIRQS